MASQSSLPSPAADPERYRGRPLVALLEGYVLECIGELDPGRRETIRQAVQRAFGGGNDWKLTLRQTLGLDASVDDEFRSLWQRNREIARQEGVELHPVQYAKMIVDENFAPLLDEASRSSG